MKLVYFKYLPSLPKGRNVKVKAQGLSSNTNLFNLYSPAQITMILAMADPFHSRACLIFLLL